MIICIIASLQLDHDSAEKTIRQWQLTSWTDNLSGLKNRDGLAADTAQLIHHPLFVAMLDIDFFKEFNNEAGHAAGDLVIKQAASHMKHVFGNSAYRIGSDEFLVIFKGNLTIFNAKLTQLEQLTQSISIENITGKVNFSIGQCYGTPRTTEALYKMIRLADISLYDAKQSGRGRMGKLMVLKT